MFVQAGRFFPRGLGTEPTEDEKQVEIKAVYEEAFQKAVSGGSKDDLENRFMSQGFMFLVAAVCLIVIVLVSLVVINVLLVPDGPVPPSNPPVPPSNP
jgi:hypothetical protein